MDKMALSEHPDRLLSTSNSFKVMLDLPGDCSDASAREGVSRVVWVASKAPPSTKTRRGFAPRIAILYAREVQIAV